MAAGRVTLLTLTPAHRKLGSALIFRIPTTRIGGGTYERISLPILRRRPRADPRRSDAWASLVSLGPAMQVACCVQGELTMPKGLAHRTMTLIDASAAILAEIQPATVRAVCYRLFVQGITANMSKAETDRVSRALTLARERGLIAWEWIVDETRRVEQAQSWNDPAAFMATVKRAY